MPRIENSIVIGADPRLVFDVTNDIARWSEIFDEYSHAKVLSEERDGRWTEIVFELTNEEGAGWRSWRILDHRELVAVAERRDPLYPFAYMHLRWSYQEVPEGTLMTWIQDFELDDRFEVPLATVLERMNTHTRHNQAGIKQKIESGAVRP
ncbi:SRPBCC family protein [Streptomyces resistomycificus]|uniref:Polyketide cyclase n=1 Tax=Streptomyces resistomycificus TaxID=67356 RepID=Q70DW8_9ACTN|nr:SRPBCC family protein [Streptomyces resistomycificus]KOG40808.1 polyketide cyclase [Streptomyces resistomycificus]KUN99227.1 polyketide cyclase [Streptomyces resistomycificus]CAE51178.1 RemI protein [Streptomyces resistomycificus]